LSELTTHAKREAVRLSREAVCFLSLPLTAFAALSWLVAVRPLPFTGSVPWVPALGISLAWRIDGLSALLLLLITGIGAAVFVYAAGYLHGHAQLRRLYVLLTLFMLSMIGCVLADDLVLLFVCWELTSLTSFLLVGFDHENAAARKAARQALLVTGSGGLALLAGVILIGDAAGSWSISQLIERAPQLPVTPALATGVGLLMLGCFTKSAQFPFHFWLPDAMAAPTPVSAYLHSATMVKLGVYLLARLHPAFGSWPAWEVTLSLVGAVTAVWAMVLVLRERDLKRILAWSTVAALGMLVMLIGLPGNGPAVAVGAFLLAHALYKAPLFFVVGNVDHGAGTRIIDRLGGLRPKMPYTAAGAVMAAISMAGLPFSFGYIAKGVIADAKSNVDVMALVGYASLFVGAVSAAVAATAAVRVFWRHPGHSESCDAHEGPWSLWLPPMLVAAAGIAFGIAPSLIDGLLAEAAAAMTPRGVFPVVDASLQFGPVLRSAAFTLGLGAVVFWFWDPLHALLERGHRPLERTAAGVQYERLLHAVSWLAARVTRGLQHGRLSAYAALLVGSVTLALALLLPWGSGALRGLAANPPGLAVAGAAALLATGAVLACMLRVRLPLLLASGLVGYGSAALFLFTGAPDLALTQLAVETVFVVVFATLLLELARLGRSGSLPEPRLRPGAALLALAFGGVMTLLLLAVSGAPFDPALPQFFGERSVPEGFGRNVVNVIIVDFRALDTLGEVAVVGFSLIAALPLLQALRRLRAERERS
jgi:multicomponent Na+:H+ antiporter subunit A